MSRPRYLSIEAVVLMLAVVAVTAAAESDGLFARGEALFVGQTPLQGKPRGHASFMPPEVVRCVNCHGEGTRVLDRALLLQQRQRRGGPPSAYDEASFCKMLETGIDPVYILVDHQMPVYQMASPDCAGLWTYLTEREAHHLSH